MKSPRPALLARAILFLSSLLALPTFSPLALHAADAVRPPLELRVMSFNLRFASTQQPNAWADRRPVMRHTIERAAPDLIGTQEGVYPQLRDLAADLPAYDWIGLGREGGSRGEFTAIFFRRDRFEPVAFDHFWLSDTPDRIASNTFGAAYLRMATTVRLRDRATGREFVVFNTHLDNESEPARQKSAELLRTRIAAVETALPVLLVGDFNCTAGASRAWEILTREAGLTDTWTAAAARQNASLNSFHNYEPPVAHGERIDWILARHPAAVTEAAIVTDHDGAQYPSDHFPVTAVVRFD